MTARRSSLVLGLSLLIALLDGGCAFVRRIEETLTKDRPYFQVSDGYMYASKNGPFIMPKGSSSIHVNIDVESIWAKNDSVHLNLAIYGAEEDDQGKPMRGICDGDPKMLKSNTWAKNVRLVKIKTAFGSCPEGGSSCVYQASVDELYEVGAEGWYNVLVAVCYEGLSYERASTMAPISLHTNPTVVVSGSVAFLNPFGYMPAEAYGLLPFEVLRAVLYMLFTGYYLIHYFIYKEAVLPMHSMLLVVVALTLAESVAWVGHYFYMNYTGEPSCCPYPLYFVVLIVLQIFDSTLLRMLLLIICLGYGIGRPRLLPLEIVAICALHVLYFAAASANQLYYFVHLNSYYNHAHVDFTQGAHYFRNNALIAFEIFINAVLLSWIYISASSTIRILREFQQHEKLRMYQRLMRIVYTFIFLFVLVTGIFLLDDQKVVDWPWQLRWLQQAIFESLPLAILTALVVLFKPTERSRLLAYTSQLPTEDLEDDSDLVLRGHNAHGLNFNTALYDDDDDMEMVNVKRPLGGEVGHLSDGQKPHRYLSTAAADDDEYGLSDSD